MRRRLLSDHNGKSKFLLLLQKGKSFSAVFMLLLLSSSVTLNESGPVADMPVQKISPGKTIPYTLPWDDMPVDLSFIFAGEKPAGRHGFLQVRGNEFVFEDGTPARFWGTNFNSGQCFPPHEHSARIAKRLAKTGVNIVRFHQMDAEWSTPNIFQYSRGENRTDTMNPDPESMDKLDYLIYCLKKEGIYVYMDLLTYRRFKTGDGVVAAEQLGDAAKPYSTFNRRLIELQKKFNYDLWTHVNPYTKLAYKDDPAIVLVEVTNENDLFSQKVTLEPYRSELEKMYRIWAEKKKIRLPEGKVDFTGTDNTMLQFFTDVSRDYYREMISHMRETGVKIPVAGTNWTRNAAHLSAQTVADFTDSHAYWYTFGIWGMNNKRFMNGPMTGSTGNMLTGLSFYNVADKPFFVSEWDNPWPNEWRAESSLLMAAVGAMQGWGGFAIHTYRYGNDEDVDMIGKPITSDAIGGVYYRGGVFDTFNDPAKFGLFYHAALIMRRGDVQTPEKISYIKLKDISATSGIKALPLAAEKQRIKIVLPGDESISAGLTDSDRPLADAGKGEVISDTKELYRNTTKKFGWIDTPRTKAVYGFTGREGPVKLTDLTISMKNDFATVAVSSLTDDPVSASPNMLLTTVGRADNTGSRYNEDHTVQLEPGHGPVQVEIIEAVIEIRTGRSNLRVMAVNPRGFITGYIPSEYKNGVFRFEVGKEYQSMYYLIQSL